jgi:hypothetical protein
VIEAMLKEMNETKAVASAPKQEVAARGPAPGFGGPPPADMGMVALQITPEVYEGVLDLLDRYRAHAELDVVALLDEGGMAVAASGGEGMPPSTIDTLGALATGVFTSMQALAQQLGEDHFDGCFHHGQEKHFHLCPVRPSFLLLSTFGSHVPSGLVRVYAGRISDALSLEMASMGSESVATPNREVEASLEPVSAPASVVGTPTPELEPEPEPEPERRVALGAPEASLGVVPAASVPVVASPFFVETPADSAETAPAPGQAPEPSFPGAAAMPAAISPVVAPGFGQPDAAPVFSPTPVASPVASADPTQGGAGLTEGLQRPAAEAPPASFPSPFTMEERAPSPAEPPSAG